MPGAGPRCFAFAESVPGASQGSQSPGPAPESPAASTPNDDENRIAQQHYENGVTFFQAGNYPAARAEFEAAYQLTHYPDLLYNLAQVVQKQGRTADEERYLREYLATSPKDATEVRTRLAQIETPPPPPEVSRLPPTPALALAAGGAAALLIGIACGGAALSAAATVADPMNSNKPFTADLLATQVHGQQLSSTAIAFDVLGGAALAAGGAWIGYWFYQRHQAQKAAPPARTARTILLPSGLGIALTGSY